MDTCTRNHLINKSINDRQKKLTSNPVVEDIISDAYYAILRE